MVKEVLDLNNKYQDIGVAVVDGILNGQKTTLIVQEFGTTEVFAGGPNVSVAGKDVPIPKTEYNNKPELLGSVQIPKTNPSLIDPYKVYKTVGVSLISLIGMLSSNLNAAVPERGEYLEM